MNAITIQQVAFAVLALIVLGSALFVVSSRNLFRAALMLIVSFFGVAGFYVLLDLGLFAVAQVMVYIGAISILIIFSVMLTRGMQGMIPRNSQALGAAVVAAIIFGALLLVLGPARVEVDASQIPILSSLFPNATARSVGAVPWAFNGQAVPETYIARLGQALVDLNQFLLPFLLIAFLVDAVLAGAIVIARQHRPEEVIAERREIADEEAAEREAIASAQPSPVPEGAVATSTDH
jgi:NADH-quinone oxidoreductase subunit J